jgi:hypothetical protein
MNSGPLSKRTKAGAPAFDHETVHDGHHQIGIDGSLGHDGGAFPGELVDDVEQLQGAVALGRVELEVEGPQGIGDDG